ncbi:pyruvate kinase PKM-like [Anneissia japonica]|uniref:pyruvate kinase PKM-like n=1 Tax=Anneissia japonica TaxID=1529436 RepID=UPI001425619D|nr:pyruvate kinase PKM-like [Anneissia japonica]XP_033100590.1 pyruvate kinase PKM-like [Anneissia japonica]XP_033100591.1 pyruvate kinase PKM-like [Anneissia japonica]
MSDHGFAELVGQHHHDQDSDHFTQYAHQAALNADSLLDHYSKMDIESTPGSVRNSGIICTIGPASKDPAILENMIKAGMNIARLNFSHGTHEYHDSVINNIKEARSRFAFSRNVGIALDTKGPEIRTGLLKGGGSAEVELKAGNKIRLSFNDAHAESGTEECIFVDYKNMPKILDTGSVVYIDDGLLSLQVDNIDDDLKFIDCTIINGGSLGSRKGVNLPGANVDLPALSEKDKADITFGVKHGVDMVFASFIRKKEDVVAVRNCLGEAGKNILIISKIENQEGLQNFDEILEVTDGIMVARGDLGIEIKPELVFLAQKKMISLCNRVGKPVICATQMLESMVKNPRPTRAETSDVANAVLDGCDCVMLSGETAKGKYPLEAVKMMHSVAREAEAAMFHKQTYEERIHEVAVPTDPAETIALAAVGASFKCQAGAIIVLTETGRSAHLISRYRPVAPVLTVCRDQKVLRQTHLWRGCFPVFYSKPEGDKNWQDDLEDHFTYAIQVAKKRGFISDGSTVICISGWRKGQGFTNTIRIIQI